MGVVARLSLAEVRQRPGRLVVTALAVVASAAAVVWVVSGYDALSESMDEVGEAYHGRYGAWISVEEGGAPAPKLLELLRADPAITRVDAVQQLQVVVSGPAGTEPAGPWTPTVGDAYGGEGAYMDGDGSADRHDHERPPVLVGTDAPEPPRALVAGRWLGDAPGAVISDHLAERLGADVGTTLQVKVDQDELPVEVVGVVKEVIASTVIGETVSDLTGARDPRRGDGPAAGAVYVRPAELERLVGHALHTNLLCLELRHGADLAGLHARWSERLKPAASLLSLADLKTALSESASTKATRNQAYAATAVSLLAALFIIFAALSMGVTERARELAVLRAVGISRRQTAGLILAEALGLAGVGWLGGLAAGWLLLLVAASDAAVAHHASLGPAAVALSGVCAFVGSLAAAVLPAWHASQVDVVQTLAGRRAVSAWRWLPHSVVLGLALVSLTPLILRVLPLEDGLRAALAGASLITLCLGFLCLCPGLIWLVERVCGPALAALLGLPAPLLRAQLSANLARTVGTCTALTVGLGLFITIQVWGYSMLGPFLPGRWTPPGLVSIPTCIAVQELPDYAALPGVERVVPLLVEQPRLADDVTDMQQKGESVVRQNNVILLGCDPSGPALAGEHPLFALDFVQGSREEALAKLLQGRHVIVPDHFVRETGLGIGETFRLIPPTSPTVTVEYTIAGVVALPGWHFVTKNAGLRRRLPRAAALTFTSAEDLRRDFGLDPTRIDLLGFELAHPFTERELRDTLEPLAERANGNLSIMTPSAIDDSLRTRTDAILWGVSQLPLITLLVTSLGVINAIVASIRARRWELGVLRAIGVTRGGLVRLVLAEALLVGAVACALSLSLGLSASWAGVSLAQFISFFGGLAPPIVIPWAKILACTGGTLLLCLVAGVWPAIQIGRSDTLELLQAGRGSR
ncbi:MAG: ABC transporter permease [Planctomycetota bacterium]